MKIDISTSNPLKLTTPALVIGCFEDTKDDMFDNCDAALDGCLERLIASKEFRGKTNNTHLIHTLGKLHSERLLLVGLGKKVELDDERLRQAAGKAVQALRGARIAMFATALHLAGSVETAIEAVTTGTLLGSYTFNQYKTKDKDELFNFEGMTLLLAKGTNTKDS